MIIATIIPQGSGGGGGGGNMSTATYDPAGIARQLLGSPIEITRAQAAVIDAANGWLDGQLYRITNPASPLENVLLKTEKDTLGDVRLALSGIGQVTSVSGDRYVEVSYNTLANVIYYIYEPSLNNKVSGLPTDQYTNFDWAAANNRENNIIYSSLTVSGSNVIGYCVGAFSFNLTDSEVSSLVSSCVLSSITISGTSTADSYIKNSTVKEATFSLTNDSKISGCTFDNITINGDALTLTDCKIIGNGETITFPAGYTAVGKTFISGVSSNFEYDLDCSVGTIYDPTGGANSLGQIIIPANLQWVGKFIFTDTAPFFDEIKDLVSYVPEVTFVADATQADFGLTAAYDMALATNYQLCAPSWIIAMGVYVTIANLFTQYGAIVPELVIRPMGNFPVISPKTITGV